MIKQPNLAEDAVTLILRNSFMESWSRTVIAFLAEDAEVKKEAFEFYYELAGLHEDLSENQKCVEIGWIAVEEMQK